ncbi:TonB-dependent receptor [Exilibacterium tricleocarpae]|uniref:TonB-dependent receptor n=1 Tax=Exilibacterium tricleocarpae TaxID=2591008 RepID=A0A545T898_9GAMM|nr:TonB-dependent receptor [Exilibacterium tricleocarpae]TQV73440.1 TonB-dependent receptor [Exilibacterium tricleocarpae]
MLKRNDCTVKPLAAVVVANVVATASLSTLAQEQPLLEEIIVTAQKRSESLQDVPISVAAVSGERLRDAGLQRFEDVSAYVPNFSVQKDPIGDRINIRGIQSGNQAGFEQSVATFVDGVYRGRGVQARFAFLDIEMLEVLRGPQGTLFGKNTIGGALNIRSGKPTDEFESEVSLAYNPEFKETEIQAYVSGPLSNTLSGRLAIMSRQMDEGWVDNRGYGEDVPDSDELAYRISLEWAPTDTTLVEFKYEDGDWDVVGQPLIILEAGTLAAFGFSGGRDFNTVMTNDRSVTAALTGIPEPAWGDDGPIDFGSANLFEGDSSELALTVNHTFDNLGTLTAILAQSEYDFTRALDSDFGPLPISRFDDSEDFEQTSFELRFASETGTALEYIGGIYYHESSMTVDGLSYLNNGAINAILNVSCAAGGGVQVAALSDPFASLIATVNANAMLPTPTTAATANSCGQAALLAGLPSVPGGNRYSVLDQDTDTWAVFGQATFSVTDTVRATLGVRYTEEEKEADKSANAADYAGGNTAPTANPAVVLVTSIIGEFTPHDIRGLSRDEESFTWSANLQWDLSPEIMLYGTASTGFKAGGFNSFYFGEPNGAGFDPDDAEFEEEEALTFELGAKMSLAQGAAELSVAAFRTEYDDLQAAVFTGGTTFTVENAAEAVTQGIEIDGRWQLTQNVLLQGSFGWIDFEFDSFTSQACTNLQFQTFREGIWAGGANPLAALLNNGDCSDAGVNDLAGSVSENTPEFQASLAATLTQSIGTYQLLATLGLNYSDEQFRAGDIDPITLDESFVKVDATFTLGPESGAWDISLIGKNLSDETTINYANDTPLFPGTFQAALEQPRSIAVRARLFF